MSQPQDPADPTLENAERAAAAMPDEATLQHEGPSVAALDYSPAEPQHDPYAAFRSGPYRLYAASAVLSSLAGRMIAITVAWLIVNSQLDEATAALHMGWLGLIQAIPLIALALPAGHVADAFPRKRVMVLTQLILVVGPTLMALLAIAGRLSLPAIYAIMFVDAVAMTFHRPARASMMPALVPLKDFSNAVTWNSTIWEICSVTGPVAAGFIIYYLSAPKALLVSAACMVCCMSLTLLLPDYRTAKPAGGPSLASLMAGVRFVFRSKMMLAVMTLDMFAVLFGGATYLLPIFAKLLHVGTLGMSWLYAAGSIGSIAMAMIIAHMPPMKHAGRSLLLAVAAFGAATIVFGLSKNYALSFVMLLLCGMADSVSVVVRHTLVQTLTPDAMRGRVSAVNQVFIGSSNELGGLESGITAALLGPVISVVAGGFATIGVVLGIAWIFPQVRKLGSLKDVRPEEMEEPGMARGVEVVAK